MSLSHRSIVSVVVRLEGTDQILVGKHMSGPFQDKWGFPSVESMIDKRPVRAAEKLGEAATMGLLGGRFTLKLVKQEPTALGLQYYVLLTDKSHLADSLSNFTKYIQSCFPLGGEASLPVGVLPWSSIRWMSAEEAKAKAKRSTWDSYSIDLLQSLTLE